MSGRLKDTASSPGLNRVSTLSRRLRRRPHPFGIAVGAPSRSIQRVPRLLYGPWAGSNKLRRERRGRQIGEGHFRLKKVAFVSLDVEVMVVLMGLRVLIVPVLGLALSSVSPRPHCAMVCRRQAWGTIFIFVIGAAWDNLPPSGPLKAFYLKRRGVAGVATPCAGRVQIRPGWACAFFATQISPALGIDVVEGEYKPSHAARSSRIQERRRSYRGRREHASVFQPLASFVAPSAF